MRIRPVGDIRVTWGESARWDDRLQRLYFVDCASQMLHWLDGGEPPMQSLQLPSLPTGVVLAEDGRLVVCLDGGLHVVDAESGSVELLAEYPADLHGRANDAGGDGEGGLLTGTLNMTAGPPGSLWRFSVHGGWTMLDPSFGNANGPAVLGDGTVVCGDTSAAAVFAYDEAGSKRVFLDESQPSLAGAPDGATVDADGAYWACVLRSGRLARVLSDGRVDQVIDLPVRNPSDLAFGGADLDVAYVVSIALELAGEGAPTPESGSVLAIEGLGVRGRPEPRFTLAG
jgi:sugar lactone lactonase YvrE